MSDETMSDETISDETMTVREALILKFIIRPERGSQLSYTRLLRECLRFDCELHSHAAQPPVMLHAKMPICRDWHMSCRTPEQAIGCVMIMTQQQQTCMYEESRSALDCWLLDKRIILRP